MDLGAAWASRMPSSTRWNLEGQHALSWPVSQIDSYTNPQGSLTGPCGPGSCNSAHLEEKALRVQTRLLVGAWHLSMGLPGMRALASQKRLMGSESDLSIQSPCPQAASERSYPPPQPGCSRRWVVPPTFSSPSQPGAGWLLLITLRAIDQGPLPSKVNDTFIAFSSFLVSCSLLPHS